ncbi:hypothetical protein Q8G40_29230, partial [Klebsiella pneumoniae]|uniref:hypothetical protein n=1 Tax=Klebsiella pneumoniae TaxID=573 RepID=UPI00301338A3
LEDAGYEFLKENGYRSFTEHDITAIRSLTELLARGMDYEMAVKTIKDGYSRDKEKTGGSDLLAVAAHQLSDPGRSEVAKLEHKMDE